MPHAEVPDVSPPRSVLRWHWMGETKKAARFS